MDTDNKKDAAEALDVRTGSRFEIIEVGYQIHHGVRDGVSIYRIYPTPLSRTKWAASYFSSGRFAAEANTLRELGEILRDRCCANIGHEPTAPSAPEQK